MYAMYADTLRRKHTTGNKTFGMSSRARINHVFGNVISPTGPTQATVTYRQLS